MGSRLRDIRSRWDLTPSELAMRAGVSDATIRQVECGTMAPSRETVTKLAEALSIRAEWLLTGRDGMLSLADMTPDYQHKIQSGPGTEDLPGYVVISPGGPWYKDRSGKWQVDRSRDGSE